MSRYAFTFLILTLLASIALWMAPADAFTLPLVGATGLFAGFFVLALFAGRKIRFDPVLRTSED
ncbi:PA3371 family protein [Pseudomonas sp. MWU13-2105]|uniref:PA3371 family protein n=1 Tax=Pseudomonas sp. MWU13-2105 TaxID=2935074 RepID=UPI00200D4ECF|nr:PA3371 family protein [Pseudomonas sp. MWU13-2105]